jgi:hypothetical protein
MFRMTLRTSLWIACLFTIVFSVFADESSRKDDSLLWQTASKEVDVLPYQKSFIDSLRNAFNILPQTKLRALDRHPVCKNETLVYQVSWGPFAAGNLILTSQYDSVTNTIVLGGKALTNNFVGAFYKMRDYAISTVDANGLYPVFFEQHLREGKRYKKDGWILYDLVNNKMHVKEKKNKSFDTPQFTHDYLSILYYIRSIRPVPGDTFTLNLFIDSKIHPMFFKCKEKTKLQTDNGKIDCILLEPRLAGNGASFNKRDQMEVWMTNDSIPTPVFIKSRIKVGSVCARLVWHNHPINHINTNPG